MADTPLSRLQTRLRAEGLAAYAVPSSDPHQSEYVPDCWQRRARVSGFTGSAGLLVVLQDGAQLWTDSRYWLQAKLELPEGEIELMRAGAPGVPEPAEWLAQRLHAGDRVGADPQLLTEAQWSRWRAALEPVEIELVAIDANWVDLDWEDRPALPVEPVRPLAPEFTGRSTAEKLEQLRAELVRARCVAHVVPALDAIAWLCNTRGADVDHNPVAISYAIVTQEEALLFVDPRKLGPETERHLAPCVTARPYETFEAALDELAERHGRIWIDPDLTSHWIAARLRKPPNARAQLHQAPSPLLLAKAVKNETERAGMRAAHVRDGVALVRFLRWLEQTVPARALDEVACAEKLEALRAEGDRFQGTSFPTISGYAGNGSIVHYRAERPGCAELRPEGLYLVDSGGQYLDGTTDVTRTVALGPLTDGQRRAFTLVLRGHLAVASARFPAGTTGAQIDGLARRPLWDHGLDYGHGTGHGVGHFLCVHEGPAGISPRASVPLRAGMVLSNEPGYYQDGEYGIRIENLVEVVEREKGLGGRPFLGFDDLTLCPIDLRCVERDLLSAQEREQLNAYHARVREQLTPELPSAEDRAWLEQSTRAL